MNESSHLMGKTPYPKLQLIVAVGLLAALLFFTVDMPTAVAADLPAPENTAMKSTPDPGAKGAGVVVVPEPSAETLRYYRSGNLLWDTLLAKLDRDHVMVVMGHEMGHYVLGHVWTLFALLCALVFVTLYAVHRSLGYLIHRFGRRFGFTDASDIASLPLLAFLFSGFFLLAQRVALAYSRHIEREADRFGLEITRANGAMAAAFTILQEENLAHPRPGLLYVVWRSRHPSIAERIEFANQYRPWETGQPLNYSGALRTP